MKKLLVLMLVYASIIMAEIPKLNANNVEKIKNHKGKIVTIHGQVINTAFSKNEKVRYLNFGDDFTKCFSVVIFSRHMKKFEEQNIEPIDFYINKTVAITGKVKIYKDHPEIIVAKPEQIQILEAK